MCTVYHAVLYRQHGFLARVDRALTFLNPKTGEATELEPPMLKWLVCGEPLRRDLGDPLVARMRGQHDHLACRMGE